MPPRFSLLCAFILLSLLTLAVVCAATDRYYSDLEVTSPDGRLCLTARSPMNSGQGPRRPFARDFTFTLTDLNTGAVLWQRVQTPDLGSPIALHVDDAGWVSVRQVAESHAIFAPITGAKVMEFNTLSQLSRPEHERYVQYTTAGPIWSQGARWYFLKTPERQLFVVRPWWGNRIIADLDAARLLSRNDPQVLEACRAAETRWAREELRQEVVRVCQGAPRSSDRQWKLLEPINILAMERDKEAIPLLREIASWNYSNYRPSERSVPDEQQRPRAFILRHHRVESLRQAANSALRLLGETPDTFPCVWFPAADGIPADMVPRKPPDTPRAERTHLINEGDSLKQIVETLGGPDYIDGVNRDPSAIEYDMDTADPFTLRITFDDQSRATNIDTIRPPKWKTPEGGILHPSWSSGR